MRRAVFNMRDERPIWAPPPAIVSRVRAMLPDWEVIDVAAPVSGRGDGGGVSAEALRAMRGAEIYLGLGLPQELLHAGLEPPGNLRWIHTGTAGVASLLHAELLASDIVLTNSAGVHAEPIAETVLAMMLHFARGLDHAVRAQRESRWEIAVFEAMDSGIRELGGATLGVIGYGGIGRAVARRARALGMNVVAVKRNAADDDVATIITGPDALPRVLEQSDFVVLTVPSTSRTRGMIGTRELELMRRGAVLINVSRGDIIDEPALLEALRSRRLRGAGLDVFATEPLPADSPFWHLPNVLITPHTSATTPRFWEREGELIFDNVARYVEGRALRNVVDTAEGY